MNRLVLISLITASFLNASNEAEVKQEIADTKAKIKELNRSLEKLKGDLQVLKTKLPKKPSEFITHTELGYISTSGNTDTETFNIDANVKKNWGPHIAELSFLMQYGTKNDIEDKNKLLTELEYDYEFTKRFSFNYLVGYKDDKFSGFDYQFYTGPGAKYKLIKTSSQNLSLDGNILYSSDKIEDTYTDGSGNIVSYPLPAGSISQNNGYTDSYASYRLKAVYAWQILKNLKFNQKLSYRSEFSDSKNYFAYSKTALSSKISDIFSAGISYQFDYTNLPATGKTSSDKTLTFNLIADY